MPRSRFTAQDIDRMKHLYYAEHWSSPRIAKFYKLHPETVLYHIGRTKKHPQQKSFSDGLMWNYGDTRKPTVKKKYVRTKYRSSEKAKRYEEYLKESQTTKFIKDSRGNIIGKEKREWKRPLNIITGSPVHLDPILQEKLDRRY